MALLELCSPSALDCSTLVVCLDRNGDTSQLKSLGWVGFELVTLSEWVEGGNGVVSDRWLFMSMEI